jgi:hypothetical protein
MTTRTKVDSGMLDSLAGAIPQDSRVKDKLKADDSSVWNDAEEWRELHFDYT